MKTENTYIEIIHGGKTFCLKNEDGSIIGFFKSLKLATDRAVDVERGISFANMCADIKREKAKTPEGKPIEDCTACQAEGDIELSDGEWETCLNCSGLGYIYL